MALSQMTSKPASPAREPRRYVVLALGLCTLGFIWGGPLPSLARTSFSIHMMLHLSLIVIAAPLISFGLKQAELLPPAAPNILYWAAAASVVELFVVWGWHLPALHEAAARDNAAFVLQQASFLLSAIAVWMASFAGNSRRAAGAGLFAMLMSFMHMTMLGILLTLAPHLIYSPQYCLGAFGFDRLHDQRLGGVLMAIGGGLPYLFGSWLLGRRLLEEG